MADIAAQRPIPELVASKRAEIAALCREYGVVRLEVFGSVMTDEFDPDRSDVDFIAYFEPDADLGPWGAGPDGLEEKLGELVGREADVVLPNALRDPFFRHLANMTRSVLLDEAEIRSAA